MEPADAALAVAARFHLGKQTVVAIHPDSAEFQLASHAHRPVQIGSIDRSREPVAGCIGHGEGIRLVAEPLQRDDWSEQFVLDEIMAHIVDFKHGGRDEAAFGEFSLSNAAMDHHLCLVGGAFDDAGEALLVGAVDDRAQLGAGSTGIADLHRCESLFQPLPHAVIDRILDEDAADACAHLPVQSKNTPANFGDRLFQVGIVKD